MVNLKKPLLCTLPPLFIALGVDGRPLAQDSKVDLQDSERRGLKGTPSSSSQFTHGIDTLFVQASNDNLAAETEILRRRDVEVTTEPVQLNDDTQSQDFNTKSIQPSNADTQSPDVSASGSTSGGKTKKSKSSHSKFPRRQMKKRGFRSWMSKSKKKVKIGVAAVGAAALLALSAVGVFLHLKKNNAMRLGQGKPAMNHGGHAVPNMYNVSPINAPGAPATAPRSEETMLLIPDLEWVPSIEVPEAQTPAEPTKETIEKLPLEGASSPAQEVSSEPASPSEEIIQELPLKGVSETIQELPLDEASEPAQGVSSQPESPTDEAMIPSLEYVPLSDVSRAPTPASPTEETVPEVPLEVSSGSESAEDAASQSSTPLEETIPENLLEGVSQPAEKGASQPVTPGNDISDAASKYNKQFFDKFYAEEKAWEKHHIAAMAAKGNLFDEKNERFMRASSGLPVEDQLDGGSEAEGDNISHDVPHHRAQWFADRLAEVKALDKQQEAQMTALGYVWNEEKGDWVRGSSLSPLEKTVPEARRYSAQRLKNMLPDIAAFHEHQTSELAAGGYIFDEENGRWVSASPEETVQEDQSDEGSEAAERYESQPATPLEETVQEEASQPASLGEDISHDDSDYINRPIFPMLDEYWGNRRWWVQGKQRLGPRPGITRRFTPEKQLGARSEPAAEAASQPATPLEDSVQEDASQPRSPIEETVQEDQLDGGSEAAEGYASQPATPLEEAVPEVTMYSEQWFANMLPQIRALDKEQHADAYIFDVATQRWVDAASLPTREETISEDPSQEGSQPAQEVASQPTPPADNSSHPVPQNSEAPHANLFAEKTKKKEEWVNFLAENERFIAEHEEWDRQLTADYTGYIWDEESGRWWDERK